MTANLPTEVPQTPFHKQEVLADAIAKSGLFGIKTKEQALALMAVAESEGRHPGSVARDYHIIQGRPALKADAMLARFQQAGGKVEWTQYTDTCCEATFTHPQGGSVTVAWDMERAKRANLGNKDNWRTYPRSMLRARVISEGIRTVYPGVVVGVYTPEEVADMEPQQQYANPARPTGTIEMTAQRTPQIAGGAGAEQNDFSVAVPVTLPSGEAYASAWTWREWIDIMNELVARVVNSRKLKEETKGQKLLALAEANKKMLHEAGDEQRRELRAEIQPYIGTRETQVGQEVHGEKPGPQGLPDPAGERAAGPANRSGGVAQGVPEGRDDEFFGEPSGREGI